MTKNLLTRKQYEVYQAIKNGESVFISGPAGVGKTEIIKVAMKSLGANIKIGLTSTTGTSALLIGGTTLHSYLGIGLAKDSVDKLTKNIFKNSKIRERWDSVDILIIDEISMLSAELFDKIEYIARVVRRKNEPFGGIQLILSGDFLQLPCVGSETFCFEAETWKTCITRTFYLTEIIRQTNIDFQTCLNEVRLGKLSEKSVKMLEDRVGYDISEKYKDIRPTILFPLNANVDSINEKELDELAKKGHEFVQYDMSFTESRVRNQDFIVTKFKKSCPAPEFLQLCIGAQVMLVVNLCVEEELANGSRGVVIGFQSDKPVVKFAKKQCIIDYYTWEIKEDTHVCLKAMQIPLKIAYAITIHKSQGCSLDCVKIDLKNIFEYGQAYCGLSRVKKLDGLTITELEISKIQAHPKALAFYNQLEEETIVEEDE